MIRPHALALPLFLTLLSSSPAEPQRLSPADLQTDAYFGTDVAIDGNTLAVVASYPWAYYGPIYLFRKSGLTWVQEQKLEGAYQAVAIDGDTLVAGTPTSTDVYHFNGSSWQLVQTFSSSGRVVDLDGDLIAAGGYGVAAVYRDNGGTWILEQSIQVDPQGFPQTTVAIQGDSLAAGGYQQVNIYRFNGSTWQLENVLAPGSFPSIDFGYPLAMDGGRLVVSSVLPSLQRVVRVYRDGPGGWLLEQELNPPGSTDTNQEGSVTLEGDVLAVGNPYDRGGQGSAWIYRYCGNAWAVERTLEGPAQATEPIFFGLSVGVSGGSLVVGAPAENNAGFRNSGAAYVDAAGVDCNLNGAYDGCERWSNPGLDCDGNIILDACETNADCNANGTRDRCDIASAASEDCNKNGVPDECDILSGNSQDHDGDGTPDECVLLLCENPQGGSLFSHKAARVNGERIAYASDVRIRPGDVVTSEIFLSCWGTELDVISTLQSAIRVRDGAISGTFGTILPVGWDAPLSYDPCPCDSASYPTCSTASGCVGPAFNPDSGAYVSVDREDYIHHGYSGVAAVDNSLLSRYRFGVTTGFGGPTDQGLARYTGTLELVAGADACGTFVFAFDINNTFICNEDCAHFRVLPQLESLEIHVCEDDGLFCNGLESCDPALGCRIVGPPSCDDGIACTMDSCDEAANGCAHALLHAACDDGDFCTRDECTPNGCVHFDDQCGDIPTASHWGLLVLSLMLLIAAKIRFRSRLA